jgi:hypothetical protein
MGYNIDNWKTIVLEDLKLDYDKTLATLKRLNCFDVITHHENDGINIGLGERDGIQGHLIDDDNKKTWLVVDTVDISGTASNRDFHVFQNLVRYSSGKYVALLIWEGGDSLSCFYTNGGTCNETSLDELIVDWVKKSFPYILEQ